MILRTSEERNSHYSNRILIHIWSALPSLTVWSEFTSDWQLLRDGRLQISSDWLFSSGLWNLADAVRSTGGHRGTWCFSGNLSNVLLSEYSDHFIKITFFFIIFPPFLPTAALTVSWALCVFAKMSLNPCSGPSTDHLYALLLPICSLLPHYEGAQLLLYKVTTVCCPGSIMVEPAPTDIRREETHHIFCWQTENSSVQTAPLLLRAPEVDQHEYIHVSTYCYKLVLPFSWAKSQSSTADLWFMVIGILHTDVLPCLQKSPDETGGGGGEFSSSKLVKKMYFSIDLKKEFR